MKQVKDIGLLIAAIVVVFGATVFGFTQTAGATPPEDTSPGEFHIDVQETDCGETTITAHWEEPAPDMDATLQVDVRVEPNLVDSKTAALGEPVTVGPFGPGEFKVLYWVQAEDGQHRDSGATQLRIVDGCTPETPTTVPPTTVPDESPLFANCDEARAAGAAPIHSSEPGYTADLDSDGDGVACEADGADAVPVAQPARPVAGQPSFTG